MNSLQSNAVRFRGMSQRRERFKPPITGMKLLVKPLMFTIISAILAHGSSAFTGHAEGLNHPNYRSDKLSSFHEQPPDSMSPRDDPSSQLSYSPHSLDHLSSHTSLDHPQSPHHELNTRRVKNAYFLSQNSWNLSNTPHRLNRTARNANDNAKEYLKHATIVAHITNGIALQTGLMDGKIPIDEVVGELLNFGSVKVTDIAEFKSDKINGLTTQMKGIQSSLDSSQSIVDLEIQSLACNQVTIESESVGEGVMDDSQSDGYFAEVVKFNNSSGFTLIDNVNKALTDTIDRMKRIEEWNLPEDSTDENKNEAALAFKNLDTGSARLMDALDKLKDVPNSLKDYHSLIDGPNTFVPLETMIHLIQSRENCDKGAPAGEADRLKNNLRKVVDMATVSKSASTDFLTLNKLAESRTRPDLKSKKHTNGFPNGISDVKQLMENVRDLWIGKITGIEGTKLNGLADGLQPLFKVKDRLSGMNDKLGSITSANAQSLSSFHQLQHELTLVSSDAESLAEVLYEYEKCSKLSTAIIHFESTQSVIGNVKLLKHCLTSIPDFVQKLNVNELRTERSEIINSFGFTDITNEASLQKEVVGILNSVKGPGGSLEKMREFITKIMTPFDKTNSPILKSQLLPDLVTGKKVVSTFRTKLQGELTVHKCFQKLKDTSGKLSHAIKMTQKLRSLNTKEISDVDEIISAVSKTSKDLVDIKSIPTSMEKSDMINELNKMPDAMENSVIIGQSVNSLQSAYRLKELESSIDELKQIGSIVNDAIYSIPNPGVRKSIEGQWGNHKEDMAELNGALKDVNGFESKLDISNAKTLSQFGTPLKDLVTLKDVKIDAKKKSKALESLIQLNTTDANDKKELETSKATLDTLATLDLQFSSHTTQFQQAPTAFKALHDFLTQFFNIEKNSESSGKDDKEKDSTKKIVTIVVGVPGFIIVVCIVSAVCVCWFTRKDRQFIAQCRNNENEILLKVDKREKIKKEDSKKWIEAHKYDDPEMTLQIILLAMNMMKIKAKPKINEEESKIYFPLRKCYNPKFYCNFKTSVLVTKGVIRRKRLAYHANWIKTQSLKFIAATGPLAATKDTDDTRSDFMDMVIQRDAEFVVMLCDFTEKKEDTDTTITNCAVYFAKEKGKSVRFGQFTITTVSCEKLFNGNGYKRVLKIRRKLRRTKTVTHLQYTAWPAGGVADCHSDIYQLSNMVNQSKKPIIVHCSDGIGRTMTFIGIQYITEEIMKDYLFLIQAGLDNLHDNRWHCFENVEQAFWMYVAIVFKLHKDNELEYDYYGQPLGFFCTNNFSKIGSVEKALEKIKKRLDKRIDPVQPESEVDPDGFYT